MAYSDVGICNLALSHIAAAPITSLTQQTENARHCNTLYRHTRDMVLREFPWSFARKQATLALQEAGVAGLWAYRYAYPADCLYIREISPASRAAEPVEYEVVSDAANGGLSILTDAAAPLLIYTARVTDPTLFDPLFVEALGWALAMRLAMPITKDRQLMADAAQTYQAIVMAARRADLSENQRPDLKQPDPDWISARQ